MTIEETVSIMIQAKHLLAEMREAQNVLWDKSLELEKLLGVDIDTCDDLSVPKLKPISAPSLLQDALNELYAGFAFIRHSVPCDSIDKEHLHAAYVLLYRVVEAQK